ncbi:MAG: hypothetical protein M0017_08395 [Desulfobacteraceae bacterium]|nr:hypothetical protein [Desulfobacteraceae bacterium]
MQSRNTHTDDSYSWQLEYRQGLGEHLAASLSYLNEGHVPAHHRDGYAAQLWAHSPAFAQRLSLAAGIGPYYYFDTTEPQNGGGPYSDEHGWGGIFSLAATWSLESRWLFQMRANWVKTSDSMDTVSALAGIGYQLEPSSKGPPPVPSVRPKKTTGNEVTLFAGQTIMNSFESEHSTALGAEYRRGLWRYVDWTASWLDEGAHRPNGPVTQLWAVKAFLNDRLALGVGGGVYLAVDHPFADHSSLSTIVTLTGSYRFQPPWCLRVSWNRILTDDNRDADVIVGGVGYRF